MSHFCEETVSFINPHNDLKPRDKGAAAEGNYDFGLRADVSRLQFGGVSGTVLDTGLQSESSCSSCSHHGKLTKTS